MAAQEIELTSPTGGRKALPWREGLTLGQAIAFVGFNNLSGQWYMSNRNNSTTPVNTSHITSAGDTFVLAPATKGGAL